MGSFFTKPETPLLEAGAASGVESLKSGWTKCPKQPRDAKQPRKCDGRSYADVARAGVEQGSLSKLRSAHFAKEPSKAHGD